METTKKKKQLIVKKTSKSDETINNNEQTPHNTACASSIGLPIYTRKNSENPKEIIEEITQKLTIHTNADNLSETMQWISQGKSILKKYFSYDDKLILNLQYELAENILWNGWHYSEAEKIIKNAISRHRKLYGVNHPGLAKFYIQWAFVLNGSEKYKKADLIIERAKTLVQDCKDTELTYDINVSYHIQKLRSLDGLKKIEEAKIIYEKGLKNIVENTHDMGLLHLQYGCALLSMGNYKEADKLFKQSYKILRKYVGPHHLNVVRCHTWIAINYIKMGCYDKAIKIFQKRLIDFDKILGINHIETTWVKSYIGNTLYFLEKYNEALPIFKETVTAVEKEFGSENEHSIWERVWLAVTLEKAGKNKEAEKYYEKLVNDCEKNAKLDILTKNKIFLYFIEYLGKNKKYKKISHYIGPCILIAEVIITKSDRIAISLYFNEEIMHAPTITVLGKNTVAQSIIQMAHDKKIPIIEDSVLAAQMIDEFEPGDVITEQYYKALAKIFAQVRGYEQCIDEPISDNIKETVDKIMK